MPRRQRKTTGDVVLDVKSGLLMRKDTCDIYVPGQQKQYAAMDYKGAVVLDLGAHIGAFTKYAIEHGADFVAAVEPLVPNAELYELNMQKLGISNYKLYTAAVVNEVKEACLYVSTSDTMAHSLTPIRGREPVKVPTISFIELLNAHKPHVIKMDIEGSEYDLMTAADVMADMRVEYVAAELHLNLKDWRDKGREFVNIMSKRYRPLVPAVITDTNWNVTGVWELIWD